jgi:hypothetical protein
MKRQEVGQAKDHRCKRCRGQNWRLWLLQIKLWLLLRLLLIKLWLLLRFTA